MPTAQNFQRSDSDPNLEAQRWSGRRKIGSEAGQGQWRQDHIVVSFCNVINTVLSRESGMPIKSHPTKTLTPFRRDLVPPAVRTVSAEDPSDPCMMLADGSTMLYSRLLPSEAATVVMIDGRLQTLVAPETLLQTDDVPPRHVALEELES